MQVTMAEVLKEAGYATAHVGKWHLGLPTPERRKPTPADHGFDCWFATSNNASPSHRNPDNFIQKQLGLPPHIANTPKTRQDFASYLAEITYMESDHETRSCFALPADFLERLGRCRPF